ncbi:DoxX family protein [Pedobacter sp. UBA4863]|uniref:DoxX family protein n=1 Tax=Pedobacter sp. UBA4863 TaxID=1947060 RepID=UPI0025E088F6|nr:DoxX family protein [Pedobacter sp. UBA4863]
MKPLIVLLLAFTISSLTTMFINKQWNFILSGKIAMSVMLLFTALGHFIYPKGMSMMLPEIIPYKTQIIYITGIIEIAAALGLFIPALRGLTGWLLITFFVLVLPANIYATIIHLNYEKGTFDGNSLNYLWFRLPLQLLFIIWTYFFTIKHQQSNKK